MYSYRKVTVQLPYSCVQLPQLVQGFGKIAPKCHQLGSKSVVLAAQYTLGESPVRETPGEDHFASDLQRVLWWLPTSSSVFYIAPLAAAAH